MVQVVAEVGGTVDWLVVGLLVVGLLELVVDALPLVVDVLGLGWLVVGSLAVSSLVVGPLADTDVDGDRTVAVASLDVPAALDVSEPSVVVAGAGEVGFGPEVPPLWQPASIRASTAAVAAIFRRATPTTTTPDSPRPDHRPEGVFRTHR